MKKLIFIAAAFAALSACSKTETETAIVTRPSDCTAFEKGQTVTLTVSTPGQTKVTSAADATSGDVNFKWEEGDKILVKVGETSAEFTLKTGAGEASATFEGTMPGSGDSFDVQFPSTNLDLSSQTYVSGGLPHNKMKFTATGCTTFAPFELVPQYSALRLNLYGTARTIGKIVVTNTSSTEDTKPTYTLNIAGGQPIGASSAEATPFFIVVPADSINISVEIFDSSDEHIDEVITTQKFAAGEIKNMPVLKVIEDALPGFFSVSADTKVRFSQGNLRAKKESDKWTWAFYDDQYDVNSNATDEDGYRKVDENETEIDLFTWGYGDGWSMTPDTQAHGYSFTDWGTKVGDGQTWRTLTAVECCYLFSFEGAIGDYTNETRSGLYAYGVTVAGKSNCVVLYPDGFTGTKVSNNDTSSYDTEEKWSSAAASGVVCLPAAGYRDGSDVNDVGEGGFYWSSTDWTADDAILLIFNNEEIAPESQQRFRYGSSVRLVSAAQ